MTVTSHYSSSFFASTAITPTVPRASLTCEYLFTGGSLADTSGSGAATATNISMAKTPDHKGVTGNALQKASATESDAITLGVNGTYTGNSTFSVSLWVNTPTMPTAGCYPPLIGQLSSGSYFQWNLHLDSSKNIHAYASLWNGSSATDISAAVPTTSGWYHLVYIQNAGTLSLYVNGLLASSTTMSDTSAYDNPSPSSALSIGHLIPSTTTGIQAELLTGDTGVNFSFDDVRIYSKALTQAEVTALYNN